MQLRGFWRSLPKMPDEVLEQIVYKLESGGRLNKPVLFETPACLKILGDRMYLVDFPYQAQHRIRYNRVFACTWPQMKELTEAAVKNKSEIIQAILIKNVFDGRERSSNLEQAAVQQNNEVGK